MNPCLKFKSTLADFYSQVMPTPERQTYIAKNGLNIETVLPYAGLFTMTLCKGLESDSGFIFEFRPDGVLACVIEAMSIFHKDGLAEVVTEDLVGWPANTPEAFATARWPDEGPAILGDPWPFECCGKPLPIFRTPLCWMQADCHGVVLLRDKAKQSLLNFPAPFVAEDSNHATELRQRFGAARKILVPSYERIVA